MNVDIKRHIDSARQVLVGVVPNPTSQIDQITNALIYKFMDDMDQLSIKNGGDPSFFIGDLEKYSWTRIMDSRIGNQERMNLFVEGFIKISESENIPQLFRNILKSAFLPYRSPEVLGLFLKEINFFDYSHPEDLGDAYEYLLSIMSSQGDAGQFRTPRHIIDFIVDAVNPTIEDKILDPACGTAGFLISAYKHILEQHDGANDPEKKEKSLTPDQRKKLFNNFEGYDIDPGMVRIAQVNMYLHQFKNPKIYQYDSLSMEERWNDKFDVILANPPFMSPKGGIKPHSKFGVQSTRSEVLFVDYIVNHLKPKGRAGIIVPEGIIFQTGTSYKQLRKNLVENGLYAVVSLPSGVFNPYSGVKTSILLFDNEISKKTSHILFIKIHNDGFDLGAQRRPVVYNDLPLAIDALKLYKKHTNSNGTFSIGGWPEGKYGINTHPICQFVSKNEISKDGDYNLTGDRYRVATDYSKNKWPMVTLGEVIKLNFGERITKNNEQGTKYPVYGGGGESFRTDGYNRENEFVIARFAMSENCVRFVPGQFWLMDSGGTFSVKEEYKDRLNKEFVGKMLLNLQKEVFKCARGGAQKNLNNDHFYELEIPFPPFEIQKKIVEELDGYAGIITGAKKITQNWKAKIDIDPEWVKMKLVEVCEQLFAGGDVPKGNYSIEKNEKHQVPIYTNGINEKGLYGFTDVIRAEKESVTISARGTIGYSEVRQAPFYPAVRLIVAMPDLKKIDVRFLKYSIDGLDIYRNGNSIPQLTIPMISSEEIALPSLAIQKQIVEKIEAERALVDSTKKLIAIYEQKTKSAIDKLWEQ